jgi:hypothetical protein
MNIALFFFLSVSFLISGDNIFDESHRLLHELQDTYLTESPEKISECLSTTTTELGKLTTFTKLNPQKNLIITSAQLESFTSALGVFYRERDENKFKIYLKNAPQGNILAIYSYLNQFRQITSDFNEKRNEFLQFGHLISKDCKNIQKSILTNHNMSDYSDLVIKRRNIERNLSLLKWWSFANNSFLSIGGVMSSYMFSLYLKHKSFAFIPDTIRFGGMIFASVLSFSLLLKSRVSTLDYAEAYNKLNQDLRKYNNLSILANKSQDFRQLFYPLAYMWKIADLKLGDDKIENRDLFIQCAHEIALTLD